MKKHIRTYSLSTAALIAALAAASATIAADSPRDLIMQARNMPVLNAQNLGPRDYTIPPAPTDATQFRYKMKGYVFGIRMIKSNYAGYISPSRYAAYADIKTSGLGALLKKLEIWAVSVGAVADDGLSPDFHVQQNQDKKNRRVEMNYDYGENAVDVNIVPALGSQGVPPASPAERFSADDTITAVLNLMARGERINGDLCSGTVRVFDSKQHYGLRMEKDGTDKRKFGDETVEAVRCKIYYEPINGFDPEDLPEDEEGATPVTAYFVPRPDLGLNIPIRFTYKVSGFKAVIKMTEWEIIPPAASP